MRRAMSKYFRTADNVLLHYYDLGAGRTLIVVSGWTIAAEVWLKHTELLARMFRLVLLDSRSQGYSEQSRPTNWLARQAADLGELLAHLRREYVVLLGWSMGASQILQYVSQFGTSGISALVFVDTFFVQPKWMKKEVERLITELREDRVRSTERYVRNMYKTPVSAEYLNAIVTGCLRTPTEVAVGLLEGFLQQTDWRPALAKIDRPVLYVSQQALAGEAELLRENVSGIEVEIFTASGHALFAEESNRFNALVASFINRRCEHIT